GDPADRTQIIDARDIAEWAVRSIENGTTGAYDGVGPVSPVGEILAGTAEGVGATPEIVWTGQGFLAEQEVSPWAGEDSLPLWLPRPEYDGMMTHRFEVSSAAGLTTRSYVDTARDTLAWLRETPDATRTGMSREREAELLDRWSTSQGSRDL
ncbi:MAG: epimerase, partial [Nocardioides sp.]